MPTSARKKKKRLFFFLRPDYALAVLIFVAPRSLKNKKKEESGVTLSCTWLTDAFLEGLGPRGVDPNLPSGVLV